MTRVTDLSVLDRDKAGGYGIQALGGMLVEYVRGDFLNVVGFPLNHFCKQLGLIFNSPPESPAHKIKRDSDKAWTLVNSLSEGGANEEVKMLENGRDGSRTSMQEKNVMGPECATCSRQDVPHSIISLLDGFKASKVIVISLFHFKVMVYKKRKQFWHYLHTLMLCLKLFFFLLKTKGEFLKNVCRFFFSVQQYCMEACFHHQIKNKKR